MEKTKKILTNTTLMTFVAMILGAIFGIIFGEGMGNLKFIGTIWLDSIKMIIVPLVFCIMITAIADQEDAISLGRISIRTLIFYLITTILATIIGIAVALIIKPGLGISLDGLAAVAIDSPEELTIQSFISGLFSSNIFGTFSSGNIIQTLVIAILLGIAILKMTNKEHKEFALKGLRSINDMIFIYITMIIKLAPVGVFFLISDTFGLYGLSIFTSIAGFIGTFWIGIILLMLIVYGSALWMFARMNVFVFLKKSIPVWMFTLASCSSSASVPVVIKSAKEDFNIPDGIAKFGLTLGSQINSGGSAILYPAVLIFISQLYGIPLDLSTLIQMTIVATLLCTASGGVPGGGIVMMLVIVQTFGMPVEVVGIIAGFYRFIDMGTTTSNVLGDLVGTICVSKWEERTVAKEKVKGLENVEQA
ncbi:dicarboxylate/amino acid:cation symporter [Planococcus shenhongbingii]|uniref:Dicarboxylate/amino acid:cation symporter n=1 Tax=Planococcus shenhongbingii TaxID=3058398 RepID=A0ABT8NC70_9BACL|nr:dicarboxylate/amino acid:cation symporter [Planococcus sp. N017]MDN7245476.1 dicarboxylate/amino acid:cation symporter [Planococcus sp. N017]